MSPAGEKAKLGKLKPVLPINWLRLKRAVDLLSKHYGGRSREEMERAKKRLSNAAAEKRRAAMHLVRGNR